MSSSFNSTSRGIRSFWEEDGEGCPSSFFALNGNGTEMSIHDALDDGKTEACPDNLTGLYGLYTVKFIKDS